MRPLEIVKDVHADVYRIGEFSCPAFRSNQETGRFARELAVTLLRKEAIRLRQEAEKAPYNMGRSHSCFVAAEALEAKIDKFLASGFWPESEGKIDGAKAE